MQLRVKLCLLGLTVACGPEATRPNGRCSAAPSVAVVVVASDSVSGVSVSDSAHGLVQAGSYTDSLRLFFPPPRLEGGNQLGTYEVVVSRRGYREWTRSGVVVSQQGQCGNVIPVQLVALLQPSP